MKESSGWSDQNSTLLVDVKKKKHENRRTAVAHFLLARQYLSFLHSSWFPELSIQFMLTGNCRRDCDLDRVVNTWKLRECVRNVLLRCRPRLSWTVNNSTRQYLTWKVTPLRPTHMFTLTVIFDVVNPSNNDVYAFQIAEHLLPFNVSTFSTLTFSSSFHYCHPMWWCHARSAKLCASINTIPVTSLLERSSTSRYDISDRCIMWQVTSILMIKFLNCCHHRVNFEEHFSNAPIIFENIEIRFQLCSTFMHFFKIVYFQNLVKCKKDMTQTKMFEKLLLTQSELWFFVLLYFLELWIVMKMISLSVVFE